MTDEMNEGMTRNTEVGHLPRPYSWLLLTSSHSLGKMLSAASREARGQDRLQSHTWVQILAGVSPTTLSSDLPLRASVSSSEKQAE